MLEASLDLPLDHPSLETATTRPWLRAYLPAVQAPLEYDPYGKYTDDDEDDEEDGDTEGDGSPVQSGGRQPSGGGQPRRADDGARLHGGLRPEKLLLPPGGVVRLLVLVATRAVRDGEELLQNYRMNPHVARPEWWGWWDWTGGGWRAGDGEAEGSRAGSRETRQEYWGGASGRL